MDHGLVYLYAERTGETVITEASGFTPVIEDKLPCYRIESVGSDSGFDPLGHLTERTAYQIGSRTRQFYLFRCLDINHLAIKISPIVKRHCCPKRGP